MGVRIDEVGSEILARGVSGTGAVIAGRRTYDLSVPWWGADGPTGPARLPVFVLSRGVPEDVPEGGAYTFVEGIEDALERAKAAAGDSNVTVMGGAQTGRQFLEAGLVDELLIHLVPVLLGSGTRMFEGLGGGPVELETLEVLEGKSATHLHFGVVRGS